VGAFTELLSQLDVDGRVKGKQFERICEWFLTNDPGECPRRAVAKVASKTLPHISRF
jgi:hypothetical protein